MRTHYFNEEYFETIDSERKAYWLGFLAADGCIYNSPKNKAVEIGLAAKDAMHVAKFAADVGYGLNLLVSRVMLYSKKMVADVVSHGLMPRKSFVVKPWQGSQNLLRHYWRGVFDGDGCITKSLKLRKTVSPYTQWRLSLVGNKDMMIGFNSFVQTNAEGDYLTGNVSPHSSIWQCSYGGIRPCQSVSSLLYDNADIYLDRKYQLHLELMSCSLKPTIISHFTADFLLPLYYEVGNWTLVAKRLGVSPNGLYKHVRKLNLTRRKWNHKSIS